VVTATFLETYECMKRARSWPTSFGQLGRWELAKQSWIYMTNESETISSEPTYSGKRVNHCCITVGRRFLTLEAENMEVSFANSNFLKQRESLAQ